MLTPQANFQQQSKTVFLKKTDIFTVKFDKINDGTIIEVNINRVKNNINQNFLK